MYQISLPTSQEDLPLRKMSDSYEEAVIPLHSDKQLREQYVNFFGDIRFGRVLENLDEMAGKCCKVLGTFNIFELALSNVI